MTSFDAVYGRPAELVDSAPGRVNLIGEHTDYNAGLVLPLAIPQRTRIELARRSDDRVRIVSDAVGDDTVREYRLGDETRGDDWLDYVQGCTAALRDGCTLGGFDALCTSTVPVGGGLASSAALEVAVLRALRTAYALALDDLALATIAHRAERDFVGARVGVMDQMAASLGDTDHALFIDTRSMTTERIAVPRELALIVIDSGITHRHAGGDYNQRRAECEAACERLGIPTLRDLRAETVAAAAALPAPLDRRVRHVVTENERVIEAVSALRRTDLSRFGALLSASHASQRDDYAVSLPDIDTMVEIAIARPGVLGARLTGGGFGGAVLVAARADAAGGVADAIVDAYRRRTGRPGRVLLDGAPP